MSIPTTILNDIPVRDNIPCGIDIPHVVSRAMSKNPPNLHYDTCHSPYKYTT